jgi:hypothetical protein
VLSPFKHRFDPFDWLATLSAERTAHTVRALSATVYLLLSLLALMQMASPGALQRIAAQPAGEALLLSLAGLLLLLAAIAIGSVALRRAGAAPRPGASDALLHFALAMAGFELAVGHSLIPGTLGTLVVGALGLMLVASGMVLLLSGTLPADSDDETPHADRLRSLRRRDGIVRGLVLAVLGAFLFETTLSHGAVALARTSWGLPLIAVTGAALLAYALHALWLLREENHLWQT